ncbi:IclR family transcriptional regulator [Sphingomonas turrisvirgatae]|jgi:DNA-binding IclR family transcriptional regulator|uniref:Transcriptional regulator n=2 Tax=Sphingomonas turrisvirgatae TaxID=1888892 RepID=A0A1E3LS46_9SPHN|nr:transcriptional regulator [Sphingomonas turrisvirgatae]
MLNAQPNFSLIDGITVLQALATSEAPVGSRELARRLNLETTRANRLLRTLAYMGIARQTADRKYVPGPGMFVLAAQSLFASGVIKNAMPHLESLRRFNLTVAFGVLWRDTVSYLYHAPPGMPSVEALGRVGVYPASKGGIGLVLLASNSEAQVRALYAEREIPGFDTLDTLLTELHKIRIDGYIQHPVTGKPGEHTLAIAVGSPPHAAVALSGWIPRGATDELLEALRAVAMSIQMSS